MINPLRGPIRRAFSPLTRLRDRPNSDRSTLETIPSDRIANDRETPNDRRESPRDVRRTSIKIASVPKNLFLFIKRTYIMFYDKNNDCLDQTYHRRMMLRTAANGRAPTAAGRNGRDLRPVEPTMRIEGGRVRRGDAHRATDAFSRRTIAREVHLHDRRASILHLFGFGHQRLAIFDRGDRRPTAVSSEVIHDVLA